MSDPNMAAQMWKDRMMDGTTSKKYTDKINAFQGNPMALAATDEAMNNYQQGVARSISTGKRKRKLLAADPARWKKNATQFGAANLSNGAAKGYDKMLAHQQEYSGTYAEAKAAAKRLPKGGIANALARVRASMEVMMKKAGTL